MKIAVTLVVLMEVSRMCFRLGGGFVCAVLGPVIGSIQGTACKGFVCRCEGVAVGDGM